MDIYILITPNQFIGSSNCIFYDWHEMIRPHTHEHRIHSTNPSCLPYNIAHNCWATTMCKRNSIDKEIKSLWIFMSRQKHDRCILFKLFCHRIRMQCECGVRACGSTKLIIRAYRHHFIIYNRAWCYPFSDMRIKWKVCLWVSQPDT